MLGEGQSDSDKEYSAQADRGQFVLINGLLCKTAEDDGGFRPSDVFENFDDDRAVAKYVAAAKEEEKESTSIVPELERAQLSDDTPYADDICFNCFGVLSRSVLLDPAGNQFIDTSSSDVLYPHSIRNQRRARREEHLDVSTGEEVCSNDAGDSGKAFRRNLRYFKRGMTERITPSAALVLLSSIEPLTCSRADDDLAPNLSSEATGFTEPYFMWPRSSAALSLRQYASVAADNVSRLYGRCQPLEPVMSKQEGEIGSVHGKDTLLTNWNDYEALRLFAKSIRPTRRYLPASMSYRLQYRGRRLLDESDERREAAASAAPPTVPSSPSSSFSCYTGKPTMKRGRTHTARKDRSTRISSGDSSLVRRVFPRPHVSAHADSDCLGRHLITRRPPEHWLLSPPARQSQWVRALWLFQKYFDRLGVKGHLPSGTPATEVIFTLDKENLFSAQACVELTLGDFQSATRVRRGQRKSTRPANPSVVSAAWHYLLFHERGELLNRIRQLDEYLQKLSPEDAR